MFQKKQEKVSTLNEQLAAVAKLASDADRKTAERIARSEKTPRSTERVTPAVAAVLALDYNGRNRPINESKTGVYADAMRRGLWRANHQGIAFDDQGMLIDGQHRLVALAISAYEQGVSFEVTRKLDREVIDTIDQALPRKAHEALTLAGIVNAPAKETITRRVLAYLDVAERTKSPRTAIDIQRYVTEHNAQLDAAIVVGEQSLMNVAEPCLKMVEAAAFAYLALYFGRPHTQISAYVGAVQRGIDHVENNVIVPCAKLMHAAKKAAKNADRLASNAKLATLMGALGHWERGETVAKFKAIKEPFVLERPQAIAA